MARTAKQEGGRTLRGLIGRAGIMVMSLGECLRAVRAGMRVPAAKRDQLWAHERCVDTRRLHEAVWRRSRNQKVIREKVLPLLVRVERAIRAVSRRGGIDGRSDLLVFARNVKDRRRSIAENYLKGKPCEFLPSSLLGMVRGAKKVTPALVKRMMVGIAKFNATRSRAV